MLADPNLSFTDLMMFLTFHPFIIGVGAEYILCNQRVLLLCRKHTDAFTDQWLVLNRIFYVLRLSLGALASVNFDGSF